MSDRLRKIYIDMTKGIGILMVIYSHSVVGESAFVAWVCTFFMPLFFICSGLCYTKPKSLGGNIRKILLPYYVWGGVGFVLSLGLAWLDGSFGIAYLQGFGEFLLGMTMWNYPLWFMVAYFVCKCVFDWIMSIKKKNVAVQSALAVTAFLAGLGMAYIKTKYVFFYPFRADIGLAMIPFMLIGYYSKQTIEKIRAMACWKKLLLACGLLAVNLLSFRFNTIISVNSSDYGNPFWFVAGVISGSYFVIILCQIMETITFAEKILSWFGKNSLTILCTHAIVLLFIGKAVLIANSFVGLSAMMRGLVQFVCCVFAMIPACWLLNIISQKKQNRVSIK